MSQMIAKAKRILVLGRALFVFAILIAGWTATKVVFWVSDLPNRVLIDGDAVANLFGQAATESYHLALRDGDTTIQLKVLSEQFAPLIRQNDEATAWIRKEYGADINALVDSDDPAVSAAASDLVSMLDADAPFPKSPNDG